MKRWIRAWAAVLVACLCMAGCTPAAQEQPAVSAPPAQSQPTAESPAPAQTEAVQPAATSTQTPRAQQTGNTTQKPSATQPVQTTKAPAQPAATQAPQAQTVTCTVGIDCKTAVEKGNAVALKIAPNGVIAAQMTVEIPAGGTVYDALQAAAKKRGLVVSKSGSGKNVYVTGIQSLGEGDAGAGSGWMYLLNGRAVQKSASAQTVQQGDVVQWRYTCDAGKDIGASVK